MNAKEIESLVKQYLSNKLEVHTSVNVSDSDYSDSKYVSVEIELVLDGEVISSTTCGDTIYFPSND